MTDLYKLHVYLFMFDLTHRQLPGSFDGYITMENETNYNVITRCIISYTKPDQALPSHRNFPPTTLQTYGTILTKLSSVLTQK